MSMVFAATDVAKAQAQALSGVSRAHQLPHGEMTGVV